MSDFWKTTFKKLKTSILISIIYHSQTNEQFKRINQTIEIALRFLLSSIEDSLWLSLLLSSHFSRKLSQQYCESFRVQQRVGKLAYKLKLPAHWQIHSIISIAQLKLALEEADSYDQSRLSHSDSILIEDDTKK